METWESNHINNKKEICLVMWYDSINFGTCLQAYALTKILSDLGYTTYVCNSHKYFYGIKHPVYTVKNIFFKVKRNKRGTVSDLKIRQEKNHSFSEKANNIYMVRSRREYYKRLDNTHIFITGSDQIWNPYIVTPPFLLAMIKNRKDVKRIAYGSSIGVNVIPKNKRVFYERYLRLFDSIGLRENTAVTEIEKIIKGRVKVKQVLDPTFLVNVQDYIELAKESSEFEYLKNEKFIVSYFVAKTHMQNRDIALFSKEHDCNVINIVGESGETLDCAVNINNVGVKDFLWLLKNAVYIVSDSFHASVFSILFQKQFIIFKRFKDNEINSQNSRISDLFELIEIPDRLVDGKEGFEILCQTINYDSVNKILSNKIKDSRKFISESVER